MTLRRARPYWAAKKQVSNLYVDALYVFSLRLTNPDYTGDCVIVERASDNNQDTFGFAGGVVNTADIASFCGASQGKAVQVYNQGTESTDHAMNAFAGSPEIYDGSSFHLFGGKSALKFDSSILAFRPNVLTTADYILDKPSFATLLANPTEVNGLNPLFGERLTNTSAIGLLMDTRVDKLSLNYRPDGTQRLAEWDAQQTDNTEYHVGYSKNDSGVINAYQDGSKQLDEITGMGAVGFTATGSSDMGWGRGTGTANLFIGLSPELVVFDFFDETILNQVTDEQKSFYGIS